MVHAGQQMSQMASFLNKQKHESLDGLLVLLTPKEGCIPLTTGGSIRLFLVYVDSGLTRGLFI